MTTCVNTIKRLFWLLAIVFVITYIISLNIENQIIVVNSRWISNNFLFAIFSGAFASLLIVLAYEILKYFQLKKEAENTIFSHFENLYNQVLQIRSTCIRALNGHAAITESMIQQVINSANFYLDAIIWIDYMPFRRNNSIYKLLICFRQNNYQTIKSILTDCLYLTMAIQTDRIVMLSQGIPDKITSNSTNTNAVLKKTIRQTATLLTHIDQNLTFIDKELRNKYKWQIFKQTITAYQDGFTSKSLEDYLSEDIISL